MTKDIYVRSNDKRPKNGLKRNKRYFGSVTNESRATDSRAPWHQCASETTLADMNVLFVKNEFYTRQHNQAIHLGSISSRRRWKMETTEGWRLCDHLGLDVIKLKSDI